MPKGKIQEFELSDALRSKLNSTVGAVGYSKSVVILNEPTTKVYFNLNYNKNLDMMFVIKNTVFLEEGVNYNMSDDGTYIENPYGQWEGSEENPIAFVFITFKAIPMADMNFDGNSIANGTISIDKMDTDFANKIQSMFTDFYTKTEVNNQITNAITDLKNTLNKQPRLFVQTSDPGSNAKAGDVWLDINNNVFKQRLSNNTWKGVGAYYN